MFKRVAFVFAMLLLPLSFQSMQVEAWRRAVCHEKLDNGTSVIFVDANLSDTLLTMFCISDAGEIGKEELANLLSKIRCQKLDDNSLHYGAEINSRDGYNQSAYYVFGKNENIYEILKNFGRMYFDFSIINEKVESPRKSTELILSNGERIGINANIIHRENRESAQSMRWSSRSDDSGLKDAFENLRRIFQDDIKRFEKRNTANSGTTLIIAGNVSKDDVMALVKKYFAGSKKTESQEKAQEFALREKTVLITKYSDQVSVPIVEMYWKIPTCGNNDDRNNSLSMEIFVNAMSDILQAELIDMRKLIASISIGYSSLSRGCGDMCVTFSTRSAEKYSEVVKAVLTKIKNIASKGISEKQAERALKKTHGSSFDFMDDDMFGNGIFDIADRISRRMGFGRDFTFSYPKFEKKYDLQKINARAKSVFCNDPCVISTIIPTNSRFISEKRND